MKTEKQVRAKHDLLMQTGSKSMESSINWVDKDIDKALAGDLESIWI